MVITPPRKDKPMAVCLYNNSVWVSIETTLDMIEDNKCDFGNQRTKINKYEVTYLSQQHFVFVDQCN